jgi:hypothetical protein
MVCKFTNRDQKYYESGAFSAVLNYVQHNKKGVQLKEKNNQLSLIVDQITTIESANIRLEKILK